MTLNIGGSGNYRDILKFNSKEGRWYHRSGEEENEIETPTMAMDLRNTATGWLLFLEGTAPNRRWDTSINVLSPKPSDAHKRGFLVLCYSTKYFDGVAELSSCSMHLSNAFRDLHAEFLDQCGQHIDQLPVVSCIETTAMKGKFGTNHKPTFKIVDWTDRPEDLPDESPADPSEVWSGVGSPQPRPQREPEKQAAQPAATAKPASALF